jgi:hypothetical protein
VEKDSINGLKNDQVVGDDRCVGWRQRSRLRTACRRHRYPNSLSYGDLKLLPWWDPLRGDPRFEKIVASLAPK